MSGLLEEMLRDSEFKRQMRRTASEIDAAVEVPVRIEQGDASHAKTSRLEGSPKRPASHPWSEFNPSRSEIFGCQPSAANKARVSVTYQGWSPGRQSAKECGISCPVNSFRSAISSRRLTELDGPPPKLNVRPRTNAMWSSAASQASTASAT